jgi:hypothetical protein
MCRFRICLLLSNYRSYPSAIPEATFWILEAQKIVVQAGINRHLAQPTPNDIDRRWRVLYNCYTIRAYTLTVGARSLGSTIELPALGPTLDLEDLEDITCPWHLDPVSKRKVARHFLVIQSLTSPLLPLCQLLRRRNAEMLSSSPEANNIARNGRSIMGELEEFESCLMEWRHEARDIFKDHVWNTPPDSAATCLYVAQTSVKLSYE